MEILKNSDSVNDVRRESAIGYAHGKTDISTNAGFQDSRTLLTCCLALVLFLPSLSAQPPATPPVDLTGASLEDLMNIQVTSVSMKEQSLSKVASSIYV